MPRKSKGARLYERKRKGREAVWAIKDNGIENSTGTSSRKDAEIALSTYISRKFRPSGPVAANEILIGHILSIYAEEHAAFVADPGRIGYAIEALDPFWGNLTAADVNGPNCRRYMKSRTRVYHGEKVQISDGTLRRELNVLQAACKYCHKEGYILSAPQVLLPEKPAGKQYWLSRNEAARFLWACRGLRIDGRQQLERFIITSIYSGTRKTATLALGIDLPSTASGWIDTEQGIIYRMGTGEGVTKKRRTPARCPERLLAHVRRWKQNGARYVCEDRSGNRVKDIKKGWNAARTAAGLPNEFTPHTLKHTAITWAMQGGASKEDAASFFSTSIQTIESTYWHHSPHCQNSVVDTIDNRISGAKRGQTGN